MQLVFAQRPAKRRPGLLVLIRQHPLGYEVGTVPLVVTEVPVERPAQVIGARLRDRLHLHTGRAALRDVEEVSDDLEFGNRLAAELRLAEARTGHLVGDLLPVEIKLERVVVADAGPVVDVVGGDALDLQR